MSSCCPFFVQKKTDKKWTKKAKKWFKRRGLDRLPDEVILCRNCGGEGIIWGLAQVAGGDK
jgi:hypothetical protein